MRTRFLVGLVIAAGVCSAASGGIAYAFATSVVPGLGRVEPRRSIAAMQGIIDEAATNVFFLLLLVCTSVLAIAVCVISLARLRTVGSGYLLVGALCAIAAGIITVDDLERGPMHGGFGRCCVARDWTVEAAAG